MIHTGFLSEIPKYTLKLFTACLFMLSLWIMFGGVHSAVAQNGQFCYVEGQAAETIKTDCANSAGYLYPGAFSGYVLQADAPGNYFICHDRQNWESVICSTGTFTGELMWRGMSPCNGSYSACTAPSTPTADLKINASDGPVSVSYNQNLRLTWSSQNAASCVLYGAGLPGGGVPTSSTGVDIAATASDTYVLTCGTASDTVTVNVSTPSLSVSCSASPSSATTGQQVTWTASASGGTGVYTYSWSGDEALSGSSGTIYKTYTSAGTKTGTVTVVSGGVSSGPVSCGNSVSVTPAVIVPTTPTSLSATPGACDSARVDVSWTAVSGATSYQLRNSFGVVIYDGPYSSFNHTSLTPGSSQSYSVRATNSAGSSGYSSSVSATAPNVCSSPSPATVDLKVNGVDGPISVAANSTVTLTWTTTGNPASCSASYDWSGTKASAGGSEPQSVGTTQKFYVINCGGASDSVTVNITAPTLYSCTGSVPANASGYASDDSGLSSSLAWLHAGSNTARKCEFSCSSGYTWNGSSCAANPQTTYDCQNPQLIGNGGEAHDSEEWTGLTNNSTSWAYSSSDTATKCEYKCSAGFSWNGSGCVATQSTVYGQCGASNNVCLSGTLNDTSDSLNYYAWQCLGNPSGPTTDRSCTAPKTTGGPGACGTQPNTCNYGTPINMYEGPTQYAWTCMEGTALTGCIADKNTYTGPDPILYQYYSVNNSPFVSGSFFNVYTGNQASIKWDTENVSCGTWPNIIPADGQEGVAIPPPGVSRYITKDCYSTYDGSYYPMLWQITNLSANSPPTTPTIYGPTTGMLDTSYQFTFASSTDPDGSDVTYMIDWDPYLNYFQADTGVSANRSTTLATASMTWSTQYSNQQPGPKRFCIRAEDAGGATSAVVCHTITLTEPPDPVVDLKVNDSNGPVTVRDGDDITLSWNIQYADTCSLRGAGVGGYSGSRSVTGSGSLTVDTSYATGNSEVYWLECRQEDDSVTVNLRDQYLTFEVREEGGGEWQDENFEVNPGTDIEVRWKYSHPNARRCDSDNSNFRTDGRTESYNFNSNQGVDGGTVGAADKTYTIICTTYGYQPEPPEATIVVSPRRPNFTPPNFRVTNPGTFNSADSTYTGVVFQLTFANDRAVSTGNGASYQFVLDRGDFDGNGSITFAEKAFSNGSISNIQANNFVTANVSINSPVKVGQHNIRITADSSSAILEADETDNVFSGTVTFDPPNPGMSITVNRPQVANGEKATITWRITNSYPGISCTIRGPGVSISGSAGISGSQETPAITAKSEYNYTCTESVSGTSWTETVVVQSVGEIEEI